MVDRDSVRTNLYERIEEHLHSTVAPESLKMVAEAFAAVAMTDEEPEPEKPGMHYRSR
jgi:hypothetical protein